MAALNDVNGDGIQDIAIGFNTTSGVRVCSGANGSTLWNTPTSDWCWAVDRIDDCTGDGINDVVAGDFDGFVYLLSGVNGQILWRWTNPTGDKIMTIRGVPDLNGNGAPDVAAGSQLLTGGTGGYVYALEGNRDLVAAPVESPADPAFSLSEAYPNPASGRTAWSLSLAERGRVGLSLFAPDGRRIWDLGEREMAPGTALPLSWDGRDAGGSPVAPGVYLARLTLQGRPAAERRVVVIR